MKTPKRAIAFVAVALVAACQVTAAPTRPSTVATPTSSPSAPPPAALVSDAPPAPKSVTPTLSGNEPLPTAGRIVDELDHNGSTQWFHIDDEVIWLPQAGAGTVTRIDPATGAVVATIETGETDDANALTVAPDGSVWVTRTESGGVVRIDPATNEVVDTIETPDFDPYALALDGERLWMTDYGNDQVAYLDLATRELTLVPGTRTTGPTGITIAGGIVWVVENASGRIFRIDATTGEAINRVDPFERGLHVAAGFDSVWVNLIRRHEVVRIGLDGEERTRVALAGEYAYGLTAGPTAVWATSGPIEGCETKPDGSFVTRIDPATDQATHRLPILCAFAVAETTEAVWVMTDQKLYRVEPTP